MSSYTWPARTRAGQLGMDIWLSLFPHDETLTKSVHHRWNESDRPAEEFRLPLVTDTSQVKPGDLILAVTTDQYGSNDLNTMTAREVVKAHESVVRRVISTTDKTIVVYDLPNVPTGGWGGGWSPEEFGEVPEINAKTTSSLRIGATSRKIGLLGSADDLRSRIQAHDDYEAWKDAFAAAVKEAEEGQAKEKRRQEAAEVEGRPKVAAVERINEIAGEELLKVRRGLAREFLYVYADPAWLGHEGRLHTYLVGLTHTKQIGASQGLELEQALKTLGYLKQ